MTDQQRLLTTSDVAIKQVAIEVKVLKIGNRQVTLAVYRQLPNVQILDRKTMELRGIPWGRVNYHVDCEHYSHGPHLHVVWQKDNELYRSVVSPFSDSISTQDAHEQIYSQLEQLDQLFIAV